jgi:hypothetical protein
MAPWDLFTCQWQVILPGGPAKPGRMRNGEMLPFYALTDGGVNLAARRKVGRPEGDGMFSYFSA